GKGRGFVDEADKDRLVRAMMEAPRYINEALKLEADIAQIAKSLSKARNVLYLGRGTSFPIALEGALKLKELSY
ncbi:SIS domain-containing protein, partial [Serratia marcescens]|uniref:SIS domain-containing protein n=1 Tax=Serratia marcescens TaxID=615 RepID=UPI0013DC75AB